MMTPQYDTKLFCDVWQSETEFADEMYNGPLGGSVSYDTYKTIFFLLSATYGNNPIANKDVNQFKLKVNTNIFKYGPTWLKRLDIQKALRELNQEQLLVGSKQINNRALNPENAPSTDSLRELTYINEQQVFGTKKAPIEAYGQLWNLLSTDVTTQFIDKFKDCFKQFVFPERPNLYVTDVDEEEGGNQ